MRMKGGILGAGGGGGSPSALSGMDVVNVNAGEGADPLVAPFSDDIVPTSINADIGSWINRTISGSKVNITQQGIYLVNASVFTNDDLTGKTGIVQAWPDWDSHANIAAFGNVLIDLANSGSCTLTFLVIAGSEGDGLFGIGITIPVGIATLHWQWVAQVVRLGGYV